MSELQEIIEKAECLRSDDNLGFLIAEYDAHNKTVELISDVLELVIRLAKEIRLQKADTLSL